MAINNICEVPETFLTRTNHEYPPNNKMVFEEYFFNRYKEVNPDVDRIYLPIQWTSFYVSRDYVNHSVQDLQDFLNTLPRDKKYFTIVQWDDGILDIARPFDNGKPVLNLDGLDIIKFSSGGVGDYPIPLINQPHEMVVKDRDIFSSFVGRMTHPLRQELVKHTQNKHGYFVKNLLGFTQFKDVMERSVFALCPRGYGKSSFRINEALNLGAIPVYVYDEPWVPFKDEIDFTDYGVLIPNHDIVKIDDILKSFTSIDIDMMRKNGREVYDNYYKYESCFNRIIEKVNTWKK